MLRSSNFSKVARARSVDHRCLFWGWERDSKIQIGHKGTIGHNIANDEVIQTLEGIQGPVGVPQVPLLAHVDEIKTPNWTCRDYWTWHRKWWGQFGTFRGTRSIAQGREPFLPSIKGWGCGHACRKLGLYCQLVLKFWSQIPETFAPTVLWATATTEGFLYVVRLPDAGLQCTYVCLWQR